MAGWAVHIIICDSDQTPVLTVALKCAARAEEGVTSHAALCAYGSKYRFYQVLLWHSIVMPVAFQ